MVLSEWNINQQRKHMVGNVFDDWGILNIAYEYHVYMVKLKRLLYDKWKMKNYLQFYAYTHRTHPYSPMSCLLYIWRHAHAMCPETYYLRMYVTHYELFSLPCTPLRAHNLWFCWYYTFPKIFLEVGFLSQCNL
jgi:hypothetical protein